MALHNVVWLTFGLISYNSVLISITELRAVLNTVTLAI